MNDKLNELLSLVSDQHNNKAVADFEGYSPIEMYRIIYFLDNPLSMLQICLLTEEQYKQIPLLQQIRLLLSRLFEQQEIKLTAAGFLPPQLVKELYMLGPSESHVEYSSKKMIKEQDTIAVHLARLILSFNKLSKIRKGRLSLTQKGKDLLHNPPALLEIILNTLTKQFNWGYFDGYEETSIGKVGFGFTLILLAKYGDKERLDSFYAKKYFAASPELTRTIQCSYATVEQYATHCYSVRTFERYLSYLGLVKVTEMPLESGYLVQKTALFDKLITVIPPSTQSINLLKH